MKAVYARQEVIDLAAAAIAGAMADIRRDVELGTAGNIEADAVLLSVEDGIVKGLELDAGEKAAFRTACDLDELIPEETFADQRARF